MSKYIDADLLRERIEKSKYVIEPMFAKGYDSYYEGEYDGYNRILDIIDSLQQEHPEVDLEKELNRYLRGEFQQTAGGNFNNYIQVASHFYELGLKARKEE